MANRNIIPTTLTQWKEEIQIAEARGTLNKYAQPPETVSASNFEANHFFALRVLWKSKSLPRKLTLDKLPRKIDETYRKLAIDALEHHKGWEQYLLAISTFDSQTSQLEPVDCGLARWIPVWDIHRLILRGEIAQGEGLEKVSPVTTRYRSERRRGTEGSPTPGPRRYCEDLASESDTEPSTKPNKALLDSLVQLDLSPYSPHSESEGPPVKDEQTVNIFLILFLVALTATNIDMRTKWVGEQAEYQFERHGMAFKARTDGYLKAGTDQARCIIEVKPIRRKNKFKNIRHQESAQIAAWILDSNANPQQIEDHPEFFLLSQDRDEIYITVPSYTQKYKNFPHLKPEKLTEEHFLIVEECNPFSIRNAGHVRVLATILLAYTMEAANRVPKQGNVDSFESGET
ncbi:MAG: hypothetical protein Q9164_007049 [Protoblastenia rupestris]